MKKLISLLLAVLMVFSVTTVAFAESAQPAPSESVTSTDDSSDANIDQLPTWVLTVAIKVGPKLAKVVLKIVTIFVKIGMALGLISADDIIGQIEDVINGVTTTTPAESTAPAESAAIAA